MAELIKVDQTRLGFLLEYAVRMIISGKVIAFPTDTFTVWALILSTWLR